MLWVVRVDQVIRTVPVLVAVLVVLVVAVFAAVPVRVVDTFVAWWWWWWWGR